MSAPWNPGDTTPPTPGVYERDLCEVMLDADDQPLYARWDGAEWMISSYSVADAQAHAVPSCYCKLPWREISPKPAA